MSIQITDMSELDKAFIMRGIEANVLSFSLFYFSFSFCFIFLFLEQLGLGLEVIGHTFTSVQSDRVVTILVTRLGRMK